MTSTMCDGILVPSATCEPHLVNPQPSIHPTNQELGELALHHTLTLSQSPQTDTVVLVTGLDVSLQ
jgi:hypothetical protein